MIWQDAIGVVYRLEVLLAVEFGIVLPASNVEDIQISVPYF